MVNLPFVLRRLSNCARKPMCTSCFRNTGLLNDVYNLVRNPQISAVTWWYKQTNKQTNKLVARCGVFINIWQQRPNQLSNIIRVTEQECKDLLVLQTADRRTANDTIIIIIIIIIIINNNNNNNNNNVWYINDVSDWRCQFCKYTFVTVQLICSSLMPETRK